MCNSDPLKFTIRSATNRDSERIKNLVFGVLAEYGLAPDPGTTDADLDDIESHYINSGGLFEVMEDEHGELIGTIGLFPLDAQTCELRKMYLVPHARGRGIGKQILQRVIEQARDFGFTSITLETAGVLKEAIGLYTRFGFTSVPSDHLASRCDQAYVLKL